MAISLMTMTLITKVSKITRECNARRLGQKLRLLKIPTANKVV